MNGTPTANARRFAAIDAACAAGIGLLALTLYAATLQPDLGGPEDTPKFQFLGYVLGTAHPPGYPLYVMLSHLFVQLPIGTIAYRANLFSATMAAFACALTYLIGRQIGAGRWTALCGAAGLATGYSFWIGAVFAEVYGLASAMVALTASLLLRWGARGGIGPLLAAVAAFALGMGNHLTLAGLVPASVCYVLWRERRILTPRNILASAVILCLGAAQYAFIIIRTQQQAPYLESSASSVRELIAVVTAERFAGQRFSFTLTSLLTEQIPAVLRVIGHELGLIGGAFVALGVIFAAVQRSPSVAFLLGGIAGMLAMVVNLQGDTNGFVAPVMVLLWPIAAYGATASSQRLQARRLVMGVDNAGRDAVPLTALRISLGTMALIAAAAMPVVNLRANYAAADQSRKTEESRLYRALFEQLPHGAGIVSQDYSVDSALQYMMFTGAGDGKDIARLGFGSQAVREAARVKRRVFAFTTAATFFAAEGLRFERVPLVIPHSVRILEEYPQGTLVVGAAAGVPIPFELLGSQPRRPRALTSARQNNAFALVTGDSEMRLLEDNQPVALNPDRTIYARPPRKSFGLPSAVADQHGARIVLNGRTVAEVSNGLVLTAISLDGELIDSIEMSNDAPMRPPVPEGALYEFRGEAPCVEVGTDKWTDVTSILVTGSVVTTLSRVGAVTIEGEVVGARGTEVRVAELLSGGSARAIVPSHEAQEAFAAEISRSHYRRPVFRFGFAAAGSSGRMRVRPGGAQSTLTMCAHVPGPIAQQKTIRPDFDSEAYFGAGWSGAEPTATGSVRRATNAATLLLPLESAVAHSVLLDITTEPVARMDIAINGVAAGACTFRGRDRCEVALPEAGVRPGVNALTIANPSTTAPSDPVVMTIRGIRLLSRRTALE